MSTAPVKETEGHIRRLIRKLSQEELAPLKARIEQLETEVAALKKRGGK